MHYKIVLEAKKYTFIFMKKIIQYDDGDGAGIPKLIGDGNEIRFLISVEYGRGMGIYMIVRYENREGKTRLHPTLLSCLFIKL